MKLIRRPSGRRFFASNELFHLKSTGILTKQQIEFAAVFFLVGLILGDLFRFFHPALCSFPFTAHEIAETHQEIEVVLVFIFVYCKFQMVD